MRTAALLTCLLLGGCSTTYVEPQLPADHPANVSAAVAPDPGRSRTLDLSEPVPIAPTGDQRGMDHEGHGAASPPDSGIGGEHQHGSPSSPSTVETPLYACPMHPEVTSNKPDQRCPKCGMKLVKVNAETKP